VISNVWTWCNLNEVTPLSQRYVLTQEFAATKKA